MSVERSDLNRSAAALFERRVDEGSSRVAVQHGSFVLHYEQLESRANGFGNAVLARRGGMAEPVAVLVRDPAALLSAELGVMKSGKYYVAVNPLFPAPRIRAMLEGTRCAIAIVDLDGEQALDAAAVSVERLPSAPLSYDGKPRPRPSPRWCGTLSIATGRTESSPRSRRRKRPFLAPPTRATTSEIDSARPSTLNGG